MRAAVFHEHGPATNLKIEEIQEPNMGDHEVKIAVKAFSLNRLDIWTRKGSPVLKIPLPHIGASDFAGEVIAIGKDVKNVQVGDRVVVNPGVSCKKCERCLNNQQSECIKFSMIGEHHWGGAAEIAVVPSSNVMIIPEHITYTTAAASPVTVMTSYRMIYKKLRLQRGELILIIGATGGVGTIAVKMAKILGAKVIALGSNQENMKRLQDIGADFVINYHENEWPKQVYSLAKSHDKKGVDAVFDSVGEQVFESAVRALGKGGRYVTCGATSGTQGKLNLAMTFWNQISIMGSTMASDDEFIEAMNLVFDEKLIPEIDVALPFEKIQEAHELLEDGKRFGKIVLVMD
ncbi:MAG: zinc-binding dehydrogenase [Candidatus Heimdallarchaeota archaeon]|nr:zinc-binding dehydrogenase [Candidatus Heimdallarchaeota archaeon]